MYSVIFMFKKLTALLIAVLLITVSFTACGNDDKTGKSFAISVDTMPEHFDPQIAKTVGEKMIAVNIFDGLFKPDENGNIVKCCAEDYSLSADGLTYTIKIRKDIQFFASDKAKKFVEEKGGSVPQFVTANDFAFGIIRGIVPETDAPDFALLKNIKNAESVHNGNISVRELGVRVVDDYTLEITLGKSDENFIYALSQPISFPCNSAFFNLTAGRYGLSPEYTLANGAFYLSTVADGKSVRIAKNESYAGDFSAVPSSVSFYLNTDSVKSAKNVDKGTYDCGFFSGSKAVKELGNGTQKLEIPNISRSLIFNMKNETLQNNLLRAGLVMCIDVSKLSENPPSGLVPAYYKNSATDAEKAEFNIDLARNNMIKAYEELGIKNLTLEIICTEDYENIAKKTISCWQKNIGVEFNAALSVLKSEDFNKKILSGEYEIAICPLSVDSDNAADFLSMFLSKSESNIFGYSSDEYDRLFSEFSSTENSQKSADCQSHLLKNCVVLPLDCENTVFAIAKGVSGVYFYGDTSNVYFYKGQK